MPARSEEGVVDDSDMPEEEVRNKRQKILKLYTHFCCFAPTAWHNSCTPPPPSRFALAPLIPSHPHPKTTRIVPVPVLLSSCPLASTAASREGLEKGDALRPVERS